MDLKEAYTVHRKGLLISYLFFRFYLTKLWMLFTTTQIDRIINNIAIFVENARKQIKNMVLSIISSVNMSDSMRYKCFIFKGRKKCLFH